MCSFCEQVLFYVQRSRSKPKPFPGYCHILGRHRGKQVKVRYPARHTSAGRADRLGDCAYQKAVSLFSEEKYE